MKKFFSVLLSIVFALCLFATLLLSIVRFNFSYSTITDIASKMLKPVSKAKLQQNQSGLFYPGEQVATLTQFAFDESALQNFDFSSIDMSNLDVNDIVKSYLEQAGVDVEPEVVAEVLASPDVSAFIDKYADKVVDYMTGASSELDVNTDDIKKLMNKSLDIYEKRTGVAVDRSGMDQAIEASVQAALPELTKSLDTAKTENAAALEGLKIVKLVLSLKTFILCVSACAALALIILLINKSVFAMFKYISIPAIADGALLFLIATLCAILLPQALALAAKEAGLPGGIFEAILSYTTKIFFQMKLYGIGAFACGIILCVLGFKLDKKKEAAS
ncbi:MAG: hypothetical protein J6V90_06520 [Treponema sp.]|nr:hypothetical protein [Treponema sp.]